MTSKGKLTLRGREPVRASGRMQFGNHMMSAQEAGAHIDAYWEYNRLVGESDGGKLLGEQAYQQLLNKAKEAAPNRLFVYWRCIPTGMDCYCVGPDSRCFCGHSYKAHAWYNTDTKKVSCRCEGCKCKGFNYMVGRGTWWIKCQCHHDHEDHRSGSGLGTKCQHGGCDCKGFHSNYNCNCGRPWKDHKTVFETKKERIQMGKEVENLAGGAESTAAACGGIIDFKSLLPGVDRVALEGGGGMVALLPANLTRTRTAPPPRVHARLSAPLKKESTTTMTLTNGKKKFTGRGRVLGTGAVANKRK
eukprot:TRINITY_DN61767_c0_g1_i1.p1 TRINITY_DN61767_c0_g1~~TRINITY_DN61767_c0_g1_i1.p1  ORF type:complete len:303 (-),score=21.72 TRINITY_DN61767_c0_g1_i1:187-1095(-)